MTAVNKKTGKEVEVLHIEDGTVWIEGQKHIGECYIVGSRIYSLEEFMEDFDED